MGAQQSESDEEALVAVATEQSAGIRDGQEDEPSTTRSGAPLSYKVVWTTNAALTTKSYSEKLRNGFRLSSA